MVRLPILVALVTLSLHGSARSQGPFLSEDFTRLEACWVPFLNYWRLKPGQWHHRSGDGVAGGCLAHDSSRGVEKAERGAHDALIFYQEGQQWRDYRFSCAVRLVEGARIGIWFRGSCEPQKKTGLAVGGYFLTLDPGHNMARLWRIRTTGTTAYHFSDPELMGLQEVPIERDHWHVATAEVVGPDIRCSIDGTPIFWASDSRFLEGSVGLTCYKATCALFDNVRVSPLGKTGGALTGKVHPPGLPAHITAFTNSGQQYRTQSRIPDGTYRIPFLPDETYRVVATALRAAEAACPHGVTIEGGGTASVPDVTFAVGGLTGHVTPRRSRALLYLERDGIVWRRVDLEKDGSFRIPFVEAGTYRLRLLAEGFRPYACDCLVVPVGAPTALPVITLEPYRAVRLSREDLVPLLRSGEATFIIDDDPEYEYLGIFNNAFFYLAQGPEAAAWRTNPIAEFGRGSAASALRRQTMWVVREKRIPEDANRVWSDLILCFAAVRDLFAPEEVDEIRGFMAEKALTYAEAKTRRWGHQYVPHSFAALTAALLAEREDRYRTYLEELRRFGRTKAHSFGVTYGPVEDSAHYVRYTFLSLLRMSLWLEGGTTLGSAGSPLRFEKLGFPAAHLPSLRKAVAYSLAVYPPCGFEPSFGNEWHFAGRGRLAEWLFLAARVLEQTGSPQDRVMACQAQALGVAQAAWALRKGFSRGKPDSPLWKRRKQTLRELPHRRKILANPVVLYLTWPGRGVDQTKSEVRASPLAEIVWGEMGSTYQPTPPTAMPSKIVHRSEETFLLLDLCPHTGKSAPFANTIDTIVVGDEPFFAGHRLEQRNAGGNRDPREVCCLYPSGGDGFNAEPRWLHVLAPWSCSRSDTGTWQRIVSFVRSPSCIVVFDIFPGNAELTVPLVSDQAPGRSGSSFLCRRSYETVLVGVPTGGHELDYREDARLSDHDRGNDVWYVDEPARLVRHRGSGPFVTVFVPRPKEGVSITGALAAASATGQAAASVVCDFPAGRDTHGVTGGRLARFGQLETDAELFLCRERGSRIQVFVVGATRFSLPSSTSPRSVTFSMAGGAWRREEDRVTLIFPRATGAIAATITR